MKPGTVLSPLLVLVLCISLSGCTDLFGTAPPAATVTTATPTPLPTTAPVVMTTATLPPTTEPVRPLPSEQQVTLLLTKDRPTSEIHLLYQGGRGDIFLTRVTMRVYSSDTAYQEYIMSNGRKPRINDEIVAPGTREPDRCEVFVISSGIRYKVTDERVMGGGYY